MRLMRDWLFIWSFLLAAWLVACSRPARAQEAIAGLPDFRREVPSLGLEQYILGPVCLSLPSSRLNLDCNPAFLAREEKRQLRLGLTANDRVGEVNDYRTRLDASDTEGIINKVLGQREALVARATSAVWYQRGWWAIGWVPFRGGFASNVRNPAYPTVAASIFKESEFFGQAGFLVPAEPAMEVGLQLRYVDRQFFHGRFDFLDVYGNPKQLQIDGQKAFYVEPGLSYSFDTTWESAISATLTQGAVYQSGYANRFMPMLDLGFRTAPAFLGGHLRTSTHYSDNPVFPDLFSRFRWGAIYEFDDLAAISLSLGKGLAGIGVTGHIDSVVVGLGWKTEEITPDQWQATHVSTLMFEAGAVF